MTWSVDELASLAAKTNPDARLVSRQLLRNILRAYSGYPGLGWNLPHDHLGLLPGTFLRELGVFAPGELPEARGPDQWILLIAQPSFGQTRSWDRNQALTWLWRQLFHGRVHASARRAKVAGVWDDQRTAAMVDELGGPEFREIRLVLLEEKLIQKDAEAGEILEEFLAVVLELLAFETNRVGEWFPLLEPSKIRNLVHLLGSPAEMMAATRPEGAPHPGTEAAARAAETYIPPEREYDGREYDNRCRIARHMETEGRMVDALFAYWEAAQVEPTRSRGKMHRLAWQKLSQCMGAGGETQPDSAMAWLERAFSQRDSGGPEFRALRAVFQARKETEETHQELCPWWWLLSFGSRPLRRELPGVGLLKAHSELAKARTLMFRSELKTEWVREILDWIAAFQHQVEERVHHFFRPIFRQAFELAGFAPQSLVEKAALDSVLDNMVERLLETRQLSFGDIRDILARNQLKLPDVKGPITWLRGDQLMGLDRSLSRLCPGAYRPSEIYTRELQRVSSLFYANSPGRFLLLWFILPFLITLVLWKFPQFMHEEIPRFFGMVTRDPELYDRIMEWEKERLPAYDPDNWVHPVLASVEDFINHKNEPESRIVLGSPPLLALTFLYMVLLLHVPLVRDWSWTLWEGFSRLVRTILVDWPYRLLTNPWVRKLLEFPPIRWFWTMGLKPALLAGIVYWLVSPYLHFLEVRPIVRVGLFLVFMGGFASRYWIRAEAWLWDVFGEFMHDLGVQSIYRLFSLIYWVARLILDWISLALLNVTEWLRPKPKSTGFSLFAKAALSMIFMPLLGLLRFILIVLVEPQVNPIKHFPTVTVGHKFMLVLIVPFAQKLESLGLNWEMAFTVSLGIITGIPGFFGFMVWELMENWRLYAANRPTRLTRVRLGGHGESFTSLFRPGFHSGTIAKLYRRLRGAAGMRRLRLELDLHHQKAALEKSIERQANTLLEFVDNPSRFSLKTVGIRGIRLEIRQQGLKPQSFAYEVVAGRAWAWTRLVQPSSDQVKQAFAGLEASLGIQVHARDIDPIPGTRWDTDGRVLRIQTSSETIVYDLEETNQPLVGQPEGSGAPPLDLNKLDRRLVSPTWEEWVKYWGPAREPVLV